MAVAVRSVAQAAQTGDVTLNLDEDTEVGDCLVVTQTWFGGNAVNMTTPTPGTWAVAATGDSGNGAQAVRVWVRFATSAGAQSIVVPGQSGAGCQARCRVLTGVHTTSPVADGAGANGFGSPTAPSVTGVDGGALCCDYVVDDPRTFSEPPPGMTSSGTQMDNPWSGYGAHQILSADGATGTKTPTISASASYAASSVVLAPSADVDPEVTASIPLAVAVGAVSSAEHEVAASIPLAVAVGAVSSAEHEVAASIPLAVAVGAVTQAPADTPQVTASIPVAVAVGAVTATDHEVASSIPLAVAVGAVTATDHEVAASIPLQVTVGAVTSDPDPGRPVTPFPWPPEPVSGFPWPPRPVRSFSEVPTP